jgi:hypothetical protein
VNLPILDICLLPHPKKAVLDAFARYEAELSILARFDLAAREELQKVRTVSLYVYDFQEIDPEDMPIVMEINSSTRFAQFRAGAVSPDAQLTREEETDFNLFMKYTTKYMRRVCREQGITVQWNSWSRCLVA